MDRGKADRQEWNHGNRYGYVSKNARVHSRLSTGAGCGDLGDVADFIVVCVVFVGDSAAVQAVGLGEDKANVGFSVEPRRSEDFTSKFLKKCGKFASAARS